jgi:hypothetical protein
MLAGQAHEIEARWRQPAPASQARDAQHHRTVMEARTQRPGPERGGERPLPRPRLRVRLRGRLVASLQALSRATLHAR